MTAPLSGSACVWYRVRVTRDDEVGSNSGTCHVVLYKDHCEPDLVTVAVADATSVLLDPGLCARSLVPGREHDLVERTIEECTSPPSGRQLPLNPGPHLASLIEAGRVDAAALKRNVRSSTNSFTVTEDVVRPDTDVLATGGATAVGGTLTLTARDGHRDGVTAAPRRSPITSPHAAAGRRGWRSHSWPRRRCSARSGCSCCPGNLVGWCAARRCRTAPDLDGGVHRGPDESQGSAMNQV
ncbi:hypothetical protein ACIPX0_39675 [Streptomyces sp. NPDC090075]|uniref:hypothetical protein n=1 Tax=Streptomyces sp. NPDC090075 TaxID=3365937 RepID=UPI0037F21B05